MITLTYISRKTLYLREKLSKNTNYYVYQKHLSLLLSIYTSKIVSWTGINFVLRNNMTAIEDLVCPQLFIPILQYSFRLTFKYISYSLVNKIYVIVEDFRGGLQSPPF